MKKIFTILPVLVLLIGGCSKDPFANFNYSPVDPMVGENVYFDNLSLDAVSVEWNFDDGTMSNVYNPVHQFMEGGTYQVQLKAIGKRGNIDVHSVEIFVIGADPVADFGIYTYLPSDDGEDVAVETDLVFVGEQIEFYNTSLDALSFEWDYGDGYGTEVATPVYSYDNPGTYTVELTAYHGSSFDTYRKTVEVVEGVNSALRITVLEWEEEYPVENASVILFGSVEDWENEIDPSPEVFTTPLGKCVFEALNYQRYYVDVWEAFHDNYTLAAEDVGWIETQPLEPGFIHDFIAYVDYYPEGKKMTYSRIGKKKLAKEKVSEKKSTEYRNKKQVQFSKTK